MRKTKPFREAPTCKYCQHNASCCGAAVCMKCRTLWMPVNYESYRCPKCGQSDELEMCINVVQPNELRGG